MRVGPFAFRYQGNGATPSQYIDSTRKAIDCATTLPLTFLYNETLQQTFRLYCRDCPKDDKFRYFIPIFKKVGGGVEPWLMARWKARVEFLLSAIGHLFLSLTVEVLQGKMCQDSLLSGRVGQFERRFQGEGVVPGEYFLVSTKLDTFCYPTVQTAPCYVPSFWHNIGMWRTYGRTDRRMDRQTELP